MSFNDLKIQVYNDEKMVEMMKYYPHFSHSRIAIGEKKWCLTYKFQNFGEEIYNFEPRSDDTWVVTYPRSGK